MNNGPYEKAIQEGHDAWDKYMTDGIKPNNPYEKETEEWFGWNRGWSTNFNGVAGC